MTKLSQDEIELILLYRRLTDYEKTYTKQNIKRYPPRIFRLTLTGFLLNSRRIYIHG